MKYKPSVSVIMPVYNSENYVGSAIESILNQSFEDFELIIVNDGSRDSSGSIIDSFQDSRIKYINNKNNFGVAYSRNLGIKISHGTYIAVMDSDDLALPNRLEREVDFMDHNRDIGICGSCFKLLGTNRTIYREPQSEYLKLMMLRNNFICHPTVILRKSLVDKYSMYYNESLYLAEDYELFIRALRVCKIANIEEPLLSYRRSDTQLSSQLNKYTKLINRLRLSQLSFFSINVSPIEERIHLKLVNCSLREQHQLQAKKWIKKILQANKKTNFYEQDLLQDYLIALLEIVN